MQAKQVTLTSTPTNLYSLLGVNSENCTTVMVQAASTNSSVIYFGTAQSQPFELSPGGSTVPLDVNSLKTFYFVGNAQLLSVMWG